MIIYQQERNDGVADLIRDTGSVSYCAKASLGKSSLKIAKEAISDNDVLEKVIAGNKDQIDLYYLSSVLVSTGWNKNDDVFDPTETWDAKDTPEDKPFNYMHDESDIIGHIVANRVVSFDGTPLNPEGIPPESFNIITDAVIYKAWTNEEQRERINKIIAEIEDGQWFVSMECLFPAFDYALKNSEGETKIVQRSEASAFLSKHLRAYGGDGVYEDYRVGRLLRNLAFSGKGLVSKPANPRSVINVTGNEVFDESTSQILSVSSIRENLMSDNLESKIAELQTELAQAKASNKELTEKVTAEKEAEYQSKIESLETVIAERDEEAKTFAASQETLKTSIQELQVAAEAMKKDMEEKDEEMKAMKKKEAMMKRKAQLEEAGLEADEAIAAVESFDSVNDEAFEAVVAMMKKKAMKKGYNKEEEKEAKADEVSEEVETAEASEEILETAEPVEEASVAEVEPEVDPAESLRSVASEWIGSLLQSPKNK